MLQRLSVLSLARILTLILLPVGCDYSDDSREDCYLEAATLTMNEAIELAKEFGGDGPGLWWGYYYIRTLRPEEPCFGTGWWLVTQSHTDVYGYPGISGYSLKKTRAWWVQDIDGSVERFFYDEQYIPHL